MLVESRPSQTKTISNHKSPDAGFVQISVWAFFRAMWMIAWSSIRHPLTTTVIDLSTGDIVKDA